MDSGDQAEARANWRRRLRQMRTLRGLRADSPDAGALTGLDADALAAAAANPDHSEAGRAAAAAGAAGPWRMAVPGFIKPRDLDRGERLFFGWGRAVRKWSGVAIYLSLLAVLIAAAAHQLTLDGYARGQLAPAEAFARANTGMNAAYGFAYAFGVAIVVWLLATAFRRRPARVLLLRKFNVRALSEPLEKVISNELRPYGHVASLSDKHIRRDNFGWISSAILSLSNPLAAAWFVIGAPIRFVYRLFNRSGMGPAVVLNARDYRNLARRLRDRIGLNLQMGLTSKEAFLVRTSDAWWRMVVRLLMESSDVVLVDLSNVSTGTAWELGVIQEENAAPRCVFVALWGKGEEAEAALRRWGFANSCHFYAPDGHMVKRGAFRAAMLDAMRQTHGLAA